MGEGCGGEGLGLAGVLRWDGADGRGKPDPRPFQPLRLRGDPAGARVFGDINNLAGTPFEGDPRHVLRRTLEKGAAPLAPVQLTLYTGLVIGDDRAQPVDLADDFLGAGLPHLLAVSGQHVAFVLALF